MHEIVLSISRNETDRNNFLTFENIAMKPNSSNLISVDNRKFHKNPAKTFSCHKNNPTREISRNIDLN